jgi:hypothetical protein
LRGGMMEIILALCVGILIGMGIEMIVGKME